MTHEEADYRLAAGWQVDLEEADALCSAQRKRYLRPELVKTWPILTKLACDKSNGISEL